MTLGELKAFFEAHITDATYPFALSKPFSWRGSYDEVAFRMDTKKSTKQENLKISIFMRDNRREAARVNDLTRTSGFYWIKYSGNWTIGTWSAADKTWYNGMIAFRFPSSISEIDERPILREE